MYFHKRYTEAFSHFFSFSYSFCFAIFFHSFVFVLCSIAFAHSAKHSMAHTKKKALERKQRKKIEKKHSRLSGHNRKIAARFTSSHNLSCLRAHKILWLLQRLFYVIYNTVKYKKLFSKAFFMSSPSLHFSIQNVKMKRKKISPPHRHTHTFSFLLIFLRFLFIYFLFLIGSAHSNVTTFMCIKKKIQT